MGLDMYLYRRRKDANEQPKDAKELCYWRKSNMIRKWFVDHTGYPEDANCSIHILAKAQLEELLSDCKAILENHSLAEELMPTEGGFFFGSTSYDRWYFDKLRYTVDRLEVILRCTDFTQYEVYYYEWW